MPELPEVETTRRGISPHVIGRRIVAVDVRNPSLRIPVPDEVYALASSTIISVDRRAKYLLVRLDTGQLIIHLGMSGSLRISPTNYPTRKHDHVVFSLDSGQELRFHDPRRFGLIDWLPSTADIMTHKLLGHLGPEPLSGAFSSDYLHKAAQGRKLAIKLLIMNNAVVVGVGNIYACEALFLAGISPSRVAASVSKPRIEKLTTAIKNRLTYAIERGGTTLRDFVGGDGEPGYFAQELNVYGREGQPCKRCGTIIKRKVIGQRSTFYCPTCQR